MSNQWEDIRRDKQAEKIVMLEAELAERNQAYGDLVKQLEHSSNTWQAEVERLRESANKVLQSRRVYTKPPMRAVSMDECIVSIDALVALKESNND